jgi:RNA polymerase sigma-70 factor (ECF subfamily)
MITRFARQEPPQAPPADAAPAEADLLAKVQQAIGKLSPRDRELIVLYYLEEKSIEQMAALVEAKRGAVEVRLHRARARLRELLGITEGDGI